MSNSPLVSYTKLSPNYSSRNGKKITKITPHHMAGNLTIETCGDVFAPTSRQASSNYGIGTDGRIGLYVPEEYRSWCSSNAANDSVAVTIEVANDRLGGDWHVSDAAFNSLVDLCVDICQRNGIPGVVWTGDSLGSITNHDMFSNTNCPGPYLKSRMGDLATIVNQRLNPTPVSRSVQMYTPNGTDAQKFYVRWNAEHTHVMLVNVRFDCALDVSSAGTANGTPVQGYTPNNTPAQWWKVISVPGNYSPEQARPVEFEPMCAPGKRLDIAGGSTEPGAWLNIYDANGTPAQRFLIADQGDGTWEIINNAAGPKLAIDFPW